VEDVALQKEISILKTAINGIDDGVIVTDRDGRYLLSNPAAERILGAGVKELDPSGWVANYSCFHSDLITPYPPNRLSLFRAEQSTKAEDELIYIRHSENPTGAWVRVKSEPLTDEEGNIWGGMVVFKDITEFYRARDKIEIYERLHSALEQTADSVVITNRRGIIEYVNPAFETTTGFSPKEAIGNTPQLLKSGKQDAAFYRNLWNQILKGQPFRGTIVNKRKDGSLYWAQQTITPMRDRDGNITHFVSVLKDITDLIQRKEQEARLLLAREVQQRFYGVVAEVPGFDIAGAAYPAEETGGDYFDFIELSDGRLCIAVGDVCGHGIGTALVMAETRAYLRAFAKVSTDLAVIMSHVNQSLAPDLESGHFVTLFLGCLDRHKKTLTYASAGHVPGFLIGRSGEVESTLGATGQPLGLFEDSKYSFDMISLSEPGQVLLLPTDGITESMAPDGCPFGIEQTVTYIGAHMKESAQQIAEGLYKAVKLHTADQPQLDDITAVVLKVQ
jgi:phosphoserine phosphatase RsbU/P